MAGKRLVPISAFACAALAAGALAGCTGTSTTSAPAEPMKNVASTPTDTSTSISTSTSVPQSSSAGPKKRDENAVRDRAMLDLGALITADDVETMLRDDPTTTQLESEGLDIDAIARALFARGQTLGRIRQHPRRHRPRRGDDEDAGPRREGR